MDLEELIKQTCLLIQSDMMTQSTDSCGYGYLYALVRMLKEAPNYVGINTGIEIEKYEDEEYVITDTSSGETELVDWT